MWKKVLAGVLVVVVLIVFYVAYEHSTAVQSQRDAETKTAEMQMERDQGKLLSEYLDSNIPADVYKLLADIDGHSTYVQNGKAEISFRVLFDFEIPYVAEMVLPIIQSAVDETGVPLGTLSIQCYAKSNQNGIEDGSMVSWRTHDLVSGTFVSGPDDYLMPSATAEDIKTYYADEAALVDQLLGRDVSEAITQSNSESGDLERFGSSLG